MRKITPFFTIMNNPKFSFFSGNIKDSKCLGVVDVNTFIKKVHSPKPNMIELLDDIYMCSLTGDKNRKSLLKQQLPAFTPSVYFDKGDKRQYSNIKGFTGLMLLDFDKIETVELAKNIKESIFNEYEEVVCAFLSPSQLGVKVLFRTAIPNDIDMYKRLHKAVQDEFIPYGNYFDSATKNAVLPMFYSHDKEILYRDFNECLMWSEETVEEKKYVATKNTTSVNHNIGGDGYFQKTLRILRTKIQSINNDGHPQVRSASLILGSRVAAGYIDRGTAENEITNLIMSNAYLSKDVKNYIKTAMWGIENGIRNPKYYK